MKSLRTQPSEAAEHKGPGTTANLGNPRTAVCLGFSLSHVTAHMLLSKGLSTACDGNRDV